MDWYLKTEKKCLGKPKQYSVGKKEKDEQVME